MSDKRIIELTTAQSASETDFIPIDNITDGTRKLPIGSLPGGGSDVVPNPSGEATDTLEKLQIDQTIYDFAASNVYGEASGAIASFADGSANPLKSLVVDINPVQAGSGTPSPSNPRAISGRSSVEVTVADDTTDPTTEETYEIALGQTIYGGKLNVTTGELTVDRAYLNFDGSSSLYWRRETTYGDSTRFDYTATAGIAKPNGNLIGNYLSKIIISTPDAEGISLHGSTTDLLLQIHTDRLATDDVSGLMGYFTNNPLQIVYELATPTTISLTPTQVSSLLGSNNIWADSGGVDVVYIRNLNLFLNQLDARVKALENA